MVQLKDPTVILIVSLFVGTLGIDRFMLEEPAMGVLKLLTAGGCGVWAIVDLFLVMNKTRELNFSKIIALL
ncbi:TM2 domain-containing protein [Christensenella sp. MSJ-20]|nr:TM2 domain-containing protein [Christensenella sp. MSJ-20]